VVIVVSSLSLCDLLLLLTFFFQIQTQVRRKLVAELKIYQCHSFGRSPIWINWMVDVSAAIGSLEMFCFEMYKHLVMSLWDSGDNTCIYTWFISWKVFKIQRMLCRNFSECHFKWKSVWNCLNYSLSSVVNRLAGLGCSSSCAGHDIEFWVVTKLVSELGCRS
jgi:hypothetical protein